MINLKRNNKRIPCVACIIGLVFVFLEILIVIGESLGWVNYNSGLDSILFFSFLILIVSIQNKKESNKGYVQNQNKERF